MLKVFFGDSIARHWDTMENIWRFRHLQFVERFGWEEIRRADGREVDQFDTDQAIHLALFSGPKVVGYSRLLPTTAPHLLSDVYPHLMGGRPWRREHAVYEWTRCVATQGEIRLNGVLASHILMTGVMEFCLTAGIEALIVETHPKLVNLLVTTGWDVTILNQPSVLEEKLVVPIEARPSAAGLILHQRIYSMHGSTLAIALDTPNPVRPDENLKRLPFLARGEARAIDGHPTNKAFG
ncbi:acyl-homoserine-lactone synthase [Pararhizobium sp. A13]|uniref:acyl-homoserine-lactone synthase n=1 Tax=Pararhizobium sp. A13 TaxID=3133975 RepID=UPI00311B3BE9